MPGIVVDGNDVEAVHAEVTAAVARARAGGGPTFLECKTYRYSGHSRTDPGKYRKPGELDVWKSKDPITQLGQRLAAEGLMSQAEQDDLRQQIETYVDEAAARAADAPFPALAEIGRYVYAGS